MADWRPMTVPLAAEIYTVREAADRDFVETLDRIASIGFLGVELVGLHGLEPSVFLSSLERLDLAVVGASLPGPDEQELEEYYEEAKAVGCTVAHTMMEEKHFVSPESVKQAAELCNELGSRAQADGIELLYHNHWWECTRWADGRIPLLEFASQLESGVGILADIYWVAAGGIDLPATLMELGPRVRRLHVKDGYLKAVPIDIGEPMTAVGDGKVDVEAALAAAPHVDWHVVELDEYDGDPFEALGRSYRYLTGRGLSRGRQKA